MHLRNNTLLQGGKYKIVRFIASGGFGCTYEAYHTLLDMRVALKEFFVSDFCNRDELTGQVSVGTQSKVALYGKLKKKFMDEARSLYKMKHPGIVRVMDVFEENGTAYYAMEYIDGESLSDVVKKRGKLPEAEAVGYIRQVAEALKYVHSLNRLHLDIKPGNIMLDREGKAVLIDFGASKHYDDKTGENTSTLLGINTKGYAPVEQVNQSFKSFSPATDIYALGATLYKLLTGVTPPSSTALQAEEATLAPLPSSVSKSTRKAVESAMQLLRRNRPQTVEEWKAIMTSTAPRIDDNNPEREEDTIVAKISIPSDVVQQQAKGIHNGHEWVDLGLSVKWATCNVGAVRGEGVGTVFIWGETRTGYCFNWIGNIYRQRVLCNMRKKFLCFPLSDQNIAPNSGHDTARENWGGTWRMPTFHEFVELVKRCKWTWISQGGRNGYFITGPNGNSIFLPSNRRGRDARSNLYFFGRYWSADVHIPEFSYCLYFDGSSYSVDRQSWAIGAAVRPVIN